jgi:hypothetical protein
MLKVTLGEPRMDLNSFGDTWDASWADDGNIYIQSDDSKGFGDQPPRNLQFHVLRGDSPDMLVGQTVNTMDEYGPMASRGPDGKMWKACGNTCIDGTLYMFVSRHEVDAFCDPVKKDNSKLQTAENSSLIVSADKGRTWRRTAQENYDSPMFPGRRFGSPFFVKYGRDGKAGVHRADEFVYAVANDGYWENGNDMILARVRREKIAVLHAADWQFHLGGDGLLDANWSQDMNRARPLIANPGKCSMTGVQYLAPLRRYIMIQWHYTKGSGHAASTETAWEFLEAPAPWGPWSVFDTRLFPKVGYYNPCVATKFISDDGRSFPIFTNGDFCTGGKQGAECLYRLTVIPCSLAGG